MNGVERHGLSRQVALVVRHLRGHVEKRVLGHRVVLAAALPQGAARDEQTKFRVGVLQLAEETRGMARFEDHDAPSRHGDALGALVKVIRLHRHQP